MFCVVFVDFSGEEFRKWRIGRRVESPESIGVYRDSSDDSTMPEVIHPIRMLKHLHRVGALLQQRQSLCYWNSNSPGQWNLNLILVFRLWYFTCCRFIYFLINRLGFNKNYLVFFDKMVYILVEICLCLSCSCTHCICFLLRFVVCLNFLNDLCEIV